MEFWQMYVYIVIYCYDTTNNVSFGYLWAEAAVVSYPDTAWTVGEEYRKKFYNFV